jgi:cardiolipin synthase
MVEVARAIGPAVISLTHVLLASGVTVHAVLHKRDPGSAMAWIGLAWLAPFFGSGLYLLLGINRVRRRARSMRTQRPAAPPARPSWTPPRQDHLVRLERAGTQLTQRPVEAGNRVSVLRDGDEAYPRMIARIETATTSIALSSYIFRTDHAGDAFIDALVAAAARGVTVRVLIDGYGGGYLLSRAYRRLRRAGIPAARFLHSPWPWRMPFLNLRSHKKVLAIDGRVAFTGGLNIGAENLTRLGPRHPVRDTHFLVEGPVVAQLVDVFADDWFFVTGEQLSGDAWFPGIEPCGTSAARAVTSGPDQDLEKIELLILEAIGTARTRIRVMTPYFLPDERIITALALAAMRQVDVAIVLPEHSNHPAIDWATRTQIGPLLAAGCALWTHPAPFDHSKLMTIDSHWCLVGSANWDIRSFRLNFELVLEIYDSDLAGHLDALMHVGQVKPLSSDTLAERRLPALLRDGAARLLLPYL